MSNQMSELVALMDQLGENVTIGPKKFKLRPLTTADIGDLEDKYGDWRKAMNGGTSARTFIVWLGVRKTDLNQDEIDQARWRFTDRYIANLLPMNEMDRLYTIALRILKISGLDLESAVGEREIPEAGVAELKKNLEKELEREGKSHGGNTPSS